MAAVVVTLFAVVVGINRDRMPDGINGFLAMRVTVKNVFVLSTLVVGFAFALRWAGLYDARYLRRWISEMRRVWWAALVITGMATLAPLTSRSGAVDLAVLAYFWAGTFVALAALRSVRAWMAHGRERRRVVIVGTGPHGLRIFRDLCADVLAPCFVVGFVDNTAVTSSRFLERRMLGQLEQLEEVLAREHVDEVHIGLPVKSHYWQIQETIRACERLGVKALYHADIFTTNFAKPRMHPESGAAPRVQLQMVPDGARLLVKRAMDITIASVVLLVASPVMLAAAIAVRLTSPGPVIYAQERCGLNRRRFRMYKFRTMVHDADILQSALELRNEATGPVFKITNDPRITQVGQFLRKTSIDELAQLFNVLRGEMSLVGPRPLPLRDVARFTSTADLRRFSVPPGLTCLWQIAGRSSVAFDEWVKLDLQYIDQWSLALDLWILVRTLPAVVRCRGAT